ncbi:hypothetical protein IKX73_00915 [Candidatus Saccharibacteria bacterium]|nr:hypothetical protein [Candidatus Saccharibacteria bacterium]
MNSERNKKRSFIPKITRPNKGFHFPKIAYFFTIVGILSEVVDAIFLATTLAGNSGRAMEDWQAWAISFIIGATCYASMALIGYQRGKHNVEKQKGEWIGYLTWAAAGISLVLVRLWVSGLGTLVMGGSMSGTVLKQFLMGAGVAFLQLVLYFGTGFMSRDSAEILSDNNIWEYRRAKRHYEDLLDELEDRRKELKEGISILQIYPTYAERLSKSKDSVSDNISQYNESARAMIEAKMAINVEPDLMNDMYDKAMTKSGRNPVRSRSKKHNLED